MDGIKCVYWGVFFDGDELPSGSLDRDIENKHVTMAFKKPCPEGLIGEEVDVAVIGYGNDGYNEGYEVSLPDWLYDYGPDNGLAHITLSVSEDGSPKDTVDLDFDPVDEFHVHGTIGYFSFNQEIVLR